MPLMEKARAQAMRFQRTEAIMDVLDTAYDAGINNDLIFGQKANRTTHFNVEVTRYGTVEYRFI